MSDWIQVWSLGGTHRVSCPALRVYSCAFAVKFRRQKICVNLHQLRKFLNDKSGMGYAVNRP